MKARFIINEISRGQKPKLGSIGIGHSAMCRAYNHLEKLAPGFDSLQYNLKEDYSLMYDLDICFSKITRQLNCSLDDIMVFTGLGSFAGDIDNMMESFFDREDLVEHKGRIRLDSGKHLEYQLKISDYWQAASIDILNSGKEKKYIIIRYR